MNHSDFINLYIEIVNSSSENMIFDNLVPNKYKKWLTLAGGFLISTSLGVWE